MSCCRNRQGGSYRPGSLYAMLGAFLCLFLATANTTNAQIVNIVTATGSANGGTNNVTATDTESVDVIDAIPNLTITKTAILNDEIVSDNFAEAGETITYQFDITNNGNVTITNVSVNDVTNATDGPVVPDNPIVLNDVAPTSDSTDDPPANPADPNTVWSRLAPNDTIRFTATYTVTQTDVDTLQ